MQITLTITDGPQRGRVFSFSGRDKFLVGRSPAAHFRLPSDDRYFSRTHFFLEVNPPRCRLIDPGSHNGTFVNEARVTEADLRPGDVIRAGHTRFLVGIEGAAAETVEVETLPPVAPPPGPAAGALIGRYKVVRELGRGGMGIVYLAERCGDGARVALKTIAPAVAGSPQTVQRFLREAEILRQLSHPHIVGLHDLGETGGLFYFAMEYVPGLTAAALRRRDGPLSVRSVLGIADQLLGALAYAHARGFVHRDIKPANLLLTKVDGRATVKLADFGLARTYEASQMSGLTGVGEVGGTAAFMPPEQITHYRDVRPAADQYSAAATFYDLMAGTPPHDLRGGGVLALIQVLERDPVPLRSRRADVPEAVAAAIHRALARDPAQRFPDAQAFRAALLAAVE